MSLPADRTTPPSADVRFDPPVVGDGAALWQMAHESKVLDVNSPYAYLLWCRDFAATSVVARPADGGEILGFVTAYLRPEDAKTLMVWQVAVDADSRGRGIAGDMLDALWSRVARRHPSLNFLETTITDDNAASQRLFTSFAQRMSAVLTREPLFDPTDFPTDSHDAETLYRIGPTQAPTAPDRA